MMKIVFQKMSGFFIIMYFGLAVLSIRVHQWEKSII